MPADERPAFLQCARAELSADRLVTPIPPLAQLNEATFATAWRALTWQQAAEEALTGVGAGAAGG